MNTFYEFSIKRDKDEALIESSAAENLVDLFNGNYVVNEPFDVKISEGTILYDILGFQDTANIAISHKVFCILNDNNVTGWRGTKLRIQDRTEDYYLFQVIGKCGALITPKSIGFYTGFKFNENSWDHADLFCPQETTLIFCTPRVKDLMIKNAITNLTMNDITKIEGFSAG